MAAPNPEELELIQEFRLKVQDLEMSDDLRTDMELLRWIRARDHDLGQAELMLRKHMEWRATIGLDQISTWELPKDLQGLLPQGFIGYDDNNCPIVLANIGKWGSKTVVANTNREDAIKPHWKMYEELKVRMRGRFTGDGTPVTQVCFIADMNGLSLLQTTPQVLRAFVDIVQAFEANYPEFLRTLFLINCPWFIPKIYSLAKPFLSAKTVDKLHFFGYNQEEWSRALRKQIPDSALPTDYGGSNNTYTLT
ncbi:unnamed protein product [Allacma fusca]|uniref:CRAL-TRIO domain-containing protein n=1 Tax=Allacma fusca TaxID=39272 RepID=A0A8J2KLA2_9HEXA|nr:unnamed protein product [Allacma fusca]